MHHGHSLSTGENVLPPLSDFTVTTRTSRGALKPMSFSDYHRQRLVGSSADWKVDIQRRVIYVEQPRPTDVEVFEDGYKIIWNDDD